MTREIFANRLKRLREKEGLTQRQLEQETGIPHSTLSKYEKKIIEPDLERLAILSEFFNVTTDYLLGLGKSKTPEQAEQEKLEQKNRREILKQLG